MPDSPVSGSPFPPRNDQEITGWRIRLYYWTRNPHILFWAAVIIVSAGIALGYYFQPKKESRRLGALVENAMKELREDPDDDPRVELGPELKKPQPDPKRVFLALEQRDTSDETSAALVAPALLASRLDPGVKNVAIAYWAALRSGLHEPGAEMLYLAHQVEPPPYANELVGEMMGFSRKKAPRTMKYFERELTIRPDSETSRKRILGLNWVSENYAALGELQKDPAYSKFFTAEVKLEVAMRQKDWGSIWVPLVELQRENFSHRIPLILTCVAGAVWLILAWQMIQPRGMFSFRIWAPIFAIPLGAISTLPVLFLDVYQSEAWGLKHTGLFFEDCVFFVGGVGLREEVCKWLLFLPLVPALLWRGSRLEMVLVAGCVGLGFAIEENVSYFRQADPSNAFGRFLTANFFHFAATGLIGLAFCDTVRNFGKDWWKFPVVLVMVSLAHGFYDAFISVPGYIFHALGYSCFILLSLAFFRSVARERGAATDSIFPATTLILGLATLVGTIIVCASVEYGLDFALSTVFESAIFLAIFIYMFFVLFRDGLLEEEEVLPNYEPL